MRIRYFLLLLLAIPGCAQPVSDAGTPPNDAVTELDDRVPPPLHPREVNPSREDAGPGIEVNYRKGRVTRRDDKERQIWTTKLAGDFTAISGWCERHDANRIYLSHSEGLAVLDFKSGKLAWQANGRHEDLLLSGELLLAVVDGVGGRRIVARDVATGREKFRYTPPGEGYSLHDRELAGLFLVQRYRSIGVNPHALLIDRNGKVAHDFGFEINDVKHFQNDKIVHTRGNIVRVAAGDKDVWVIPFKHPDGYDCGGLLEVPGGELLCYRYGPINDSGVLVMRFDPHTGKKKWEVECEALGVGHSKYHHQASLALATDRVRITSRASSGSFVEILDLKTGKQVKRKQTPHE